VLLRVCSPPINSRLSNHKFPKENVLYHLKKLLRRKITLKSFISNFEFRSSAQALLSFLRGIENHLGESLLTQKSLMLKETQEVAGLDELFESKFKNSPQTPLVLLVVSDATKSPFDQVVSFYYDISNLQIQGDSYGLRGILLESRGLCMASYKVNTNDWVLFNKNKAKKFYSWSDLVVKFCELELLPSVVIFCKEDNPSNIEVEKDSKKKIKDIQNAKRASKLWPSNCVSFWPDEAFRQLVKSEIEPLKIVVEETNNKPRFEPPPLVPVIPQPSSSLFKPPTLESLIGSGSASYTSSMQNLKWFKNIPALHIDKNTSRLVLYFHGNNEDLGTIKSEVSQLSQKLEASVLACEYPGFGVYESQSSKVSGIKSDLKTINNFLPKSENSLLVIGKEMGCGVAADYALSFGATFLALICPFEFKNAFGDSIGIFTNSSELKLPNTACLTILSSQELPGNVLKDSNFKKLKFEKLDTDFNNANFAEIATKLSGFALENCPDPPKEAQLNPRLSMSTLKGWDRKLPHEIFEPSIDFRGSLQESMQYPSIKSSIQKKTPPPLINNPGGEQKSVDTVPPNPFNQSQNSVYSTQTPGSQAIPFHPTVVPPVQKPPNVQPPVTPNIQPIPPVQKPSVQPPGPPPVQKPSVQPPDLSQEPSVQPFSNPDKWSCEFCTFINVQKNNICDICNKSKSDSNK